MASIVMGNESVIESVKVDPEGDAAPGNLKVLKRKDLGNQVTTLSIPDSWPLSEKLAFIETTVRMHFAEKPTWVTSDDPLLAQIVSTQYGCREGRPRDWKVGK